MKKLHDQIQEKAHYDPTEVNKSIERQTRKLKYAKFIIQNWITKLNLKFSFLLKDLRKRKKRKTMNKNY